MATKTCIWTDTVTDTETRAGNDVLRVEFIEIASLERPSRGEGEGKTRFKSRVICGLCICSIWALLGLAIRFISVKDD